MPEAARSFLLIRQEFQNGDVVFEQLQRTVLSQNAPNLDILRAGHENLRVQLAQSSQEHEHDTTDFGVRATDCKRPRKISRASFEPLARHVEGLRVGTNRIPCKCSLTEQRL